MSKEIEIKKKEFLNNEFLQLVISGALKTRNKKSPIYNKNCSDQDKESFRESIKKTLIEYSKEYLNKVEPEKHILNIEKFAEEITEKHKNILSGGKLRIGIAQKLLNLYLKYLWTSNIIEESPPHCPIDSVVLKELKKEFKEDLVLKKIIWAEIKDKNEYKDIIDKIKDKNIAEWELDLWNNNFKSL